MGFPAVNSTSLGDLPTLPLMKAPSPTNGEYVSRAILFMGEFVGIYSFGRIRKLICFSFCVNEAQRKEVIESKPVIGFDSL